MSLRWGTLEVTVSTLCSSPLTLCRRLRSVYAWSVPVSAPCPCAPSPPAEPCNLSWTAPHSAPTLTGNKDNIRCDNCTEVDVKEEEKKKQTSNLRGRCLPCVVVVCLLISCSAASSFSFWNVEGSPCQHAINRHSQMLRPWDNIWPRKKRDVFSRINCWS